MFREWTDLKVGWRRTATLAFAGLALAIAAACGETDVTNTSVAVGQAATVEAPEMAGYEPVRISNCGHEVTYTAPPKRAITLNQHATEVMLALGLQDSMIGTAYIDDEILPEYREVYSQIEVLAEQYPSREVLLGADPDFLFGGFASAFTRPENSPPRDELLRLGIHSYLSTASCSTREGPLTLDQVYVDFLNVGRIFGVEDRAAALVERWEAELADVKSRIGSGVASPKVFLYDSGDDAPFTAGCCGVANLVIEEASGANIFGDLPGNYKTVNWEEVVERDPDVVVLIEADWSTSADKEEILLESESLASISAIENERFVVVPFSSTVPGPRVPELIKTLVTAFYP